MLQPIQLRDVSVRYAREIAELRDFLAKAALPLDTAGTLGEVAARLRVERGFRRDLVSHVWVVLHLCGRQISYSDLLGVLAVAAAGTQFAAAADEADAHELLHFLMEARRSFDMVSDARVIPAAVAEPAALAFMPLRPVKDVEKDLGRDVFDEDEERRSTRWIPLAWAGSACVLVVLLVGWWMHRGSSAEHVAAPVTSTVASEKAAPVISEKTEDVPVVARRSEAKVAAVRTPPAAPNVRSRPMVVGSKPAAGTAREASASKPYEAKSYAAASPAAPVSSGNAVTPAAVPVTSEGGYVAAAAPKAVAPLRRRANAPPAVNPAVNANSRVGTSGAAHGGTVLPTSLGIMAANVTYSPAPTYPVAASAAHVQGEVRVEAEVDEDGNVSSTRVISGPPLLRDAATDAVQRWHYRPYMAEGRPIATNALVVMDFQLP